MVSTSHIYFQRISQKTKDRIRITEEQARIRKAEIDSTSPLHLLLTQIGPLPHPLRVNPVRAFHSNLVAK